MEMVSRNTAVALTLLTSFTDFAVAIAPAAAGQGGSVQASSFDEPRAERFGRQADMEPAAAEPFKVRESEKQSGIGSSIVVYGGTDVGDRGTDPQQAAPLRYDGRAPRGDLIEGVPIEILELVARISFEEAVDTNLILSVMRVENAAFDLAAVSDAGAVGLMQLKPVTGAYYGARNLTDPEQNIRAGARFLAELVQKYDNPVLVAAAYHAGEPRVDAHASMPLIRETADYVTKVVGLLTARPPAGARDLARAGPAAPAHANGGTRRMRRASSSMLVYTADSAEQAQVLQVAGETSGRPVRIRKEQ